MTFYFELALVVVMKVVIGDVRITVLKFLDHRSWPVGGAWGPRAAAFGRRVGARPASVGDAF